MTLPAQEDLLVLGSEAGGNDSRSYTAGILGSNVLVVEKADLVGGTSAPSVGSVWIVGG
jgi:hypothetical protein